MNVRKEFKDGYQFPLENVQIEWAYFVSPDTKFGKSEWKCTIRLEESLAKSMKDSGFNVKNTKDKKTFTAGDEEYYYLIATTKTIINGKEMNPPRVVGDDGKTPVDGSKIGNGSIVNLNVYAKYWEVNGQTFLPLRLNSVQVVKLVEYNGTSFKPINQQSEDKPSEMPF